MQNFKEFCNVILCFLEKILFGVVDFIFCTMKYVCGMTLDAKFEYT